MPCWDEVSKSTSSRFWRGRNSEPSSFGDLRLVDSETGSKREVTFGKYQAYRQAVENYTQKLREFCRSRGIGFSRVTSDATLESVLLKDLRECALLA